MSTDQNILHSKGSNFERATQNNGLILYTHFMPITNNNRKQPVPHDFFGNVRRFPDLFQADSAFLRKMERKARMPLANIQDTETNFQIELTAPGFDKKDFILIFDDGYLNVSAEKEETSKADEETYQRREFMCHSFCRSFRLPEHALIDRIDARYKNGILIITVPKVADNSEREKRKIAVH